MNNIKVLHILNTGSYSGAENVVATIIEHTKKDVDGIYTSLDGTIREILQEKNIEFVAFNKLNIKNLKRVIKETKPDIIHAHDFTAGIIASMSTVKIPIINHLHNNSLWLGTFSIKSLVYALSCTRYKYILTVSDSVMNEYIFRRLCINKSLTIGNPIDIKSIQSKVNKKSQTINFDIIFLGRLTQPKNPVFFIDIVAGIQKVIPELRVAIVGDGELRNDVENKIKELQLDNNITVYGFLKNPYEILNESKILCMPSLWEGFGLAAVEALALGKPVFASPVGGLVNIVDNTCGDLCHSKEDYINKIINILLDDVKYQDKCIGAIKRAEKLNNIDEYTQKIIYLYEKILHNKS